MKILVFVRKFNDSTHTFIYNELQGLLAEGHQVKVLCTERMYEEKYPFPAVEVAKLSILQRFISNRRHQLGISMRFPNRPLRRSIAKAVLAFQPDVIHCHFGPDALYFLDNYQGDKLPIFVHFHGFDASILLHDALYCQRLNAIFKRHDVFPIFVSNFMRANVERAGIQLLRHHILYYGTATDFFKPVAEPRVKTDRIQFLQVSSFREKKGHLYTLQALAKWQQQHPQQSWQLVLTGEGPEQAQLIATAEQLGIAQHLKFVGFVNTQQAKVLMEEADIFLHHSVTGIKDGDMEGIPNAVMEAMAMELPILATWHAGIPELVADEINGYLVNERDVDHYTQRLGDIMHWPRQPQNREKVVTTFEQRQHAKLLVSYYEAAIKTLI